MVLVDYPDSEADASGPDSQPRPHSPPRSPHIDQKESKSSRKRKHDAFAETRQTQKPEPPPLPSAFHSLYATNVRTSTSDDPTLHGGRRRQVPHVEGNWPTHVYIEWYPSRAESTILETTLRKIQPKVVGKTASSPSSRVHSLLQSDLGVQLPLHISLSAPLMLRNEQRALFLEKLEGAIEGSGVRPFQVHVTGLDWVPNSEKTRWFLVLRLKAPETDGLNSLLAVTNCVARDSGLEMLYADQESQEGGLLEKETCMGGSGTKKKGLNHGKHKEFSTIVPTDCTSRFHSSIAWQLEQPDKENLGSETALKSVGYLSISCYCLKVKIGNAIHDIPLTRRRQLEQGLGRR